MAEAEASNDARERDCSSFDVGQVADQVIADCGGDARAAVIELVAIVRQLAEDNRALATVSSRGFARRPFRASKPR